MARAESEDEIKVLGRITIASAHGGDVGSDGEEGGDLPVMPSVADDDGYTSRTGPDHGTSGTRPIRPTTGR